MARRRSRIRSTLVSLLLLAATYSIVDYMNTGTLHWPGDLKSALQDIAGKAPQQSAGATMRDIVDAGQSLLDRSDSVALDPAPRDLLTGHATRITDGDTFTLNVNGQQEERVRLHGVDAPERKQPHGPAAGAELARLIEGREVRVEVVERDNYGRLVGQVWIGDLDINLALVDGGHAWWYEYYAQERRDLELAEEAARRAQRGLWAQRNPVPPWEWRRNQR